MSHQRTVYVVDRDLESRRALTGHLAAIGAEAWPFQSGAEFLEIVDHLMPACILLDMGLKGPAGLDVLRKLQERQGGWPVIGLSASPQLTVAVQAMKLGAIDFLEKPVPGQVLAEALLPAWAALERSIEEGEARRSAQERVARLTPREVDIALALLAGRPNKAVAHEFGISVRTVEMHRAHIMAKLGVKSLAEAAAIASRAGLGAAPPRAVPAGPAAAPRLPLRQVASSAQPFLARRVGTRSAC